MDLLGGGGQGRQTIRECLGAVSYGCESPYLYLESMTEHIYVVDRKYTVRLFRHGLLREWEC